ncbi:arsinothricin resistance N-acetyltransferase ArsN1 family B [Haladaptatus salinisoli]|uniref:arsinothricin resistance N-acetyltransferase ArsN1 family B n=1 Tax=Haladaptatus salinisoli TaxID=2884876 RepID=UPI001D0AC884|nr:arsinothricin resistance N-acetyltransferase ArsN1 family B [Haladaptatus salinisoli]
MVTVRLAEADDAPRIAAIYAPIVRETVVSFETDPPDDEEVAERISKTLPTYPWLVCERDEEILGYAYASAHRTRDAYRWSVDASVYVHDGHRRSGVGRGLYESLFALLRRQGFYNAYAGIALPNPASVGLHESMGFEEVGVYRNVGYKDGAWRDVGWWHLRLRPGDSDASGNSDSPDDPEPPSSLTELESRTKAEALRRGVRSMRIT